MNPAPLINNTSLIIMYQSLLCMAMVFFVALPSVDCIQDCDRPSKPQRSCILPSKIDHYSHYKHDGFVYNTIKARVGKVSSGAQHARRTVNKLWKSLKHIPEVQTEIAKAEVLTADTIREIEILDRMYSRLEEQCNEARLSCGSPTAEKLRIGFSKFLRRLFDTSWEPMVEKWRAEDAAMRT